MIIRPALSGDDKVIVELSNEALESGSYTYKNATLLVIESLYLKKPLQLINSTLKSKTTNQGEGQSTTDLNQSDETNPNPTFLKCENTTNTLLADNSLIVECSPLYTATLTTPDKLPIIQASPDFEGESLIMVSEDVTIKNIVFPAPTLSKNIPYISKLNAKNDLRITLDYLFVIYKGLKDLTEEILYYFEINPSDTVASLTEDTVGDLAENLDDADRQLLGIRASAEQLKSMLSVHTEEATEASANDIPSAQKPDKGSTMDAASSSPKEPMPAEECYLMHELNDFTRICQELQNTNAQHSPPTSLDNPIADEQHTLTALAQKRSMPQEKTKTPDSGLPIKVIPARTTPEDQYATVNITLPPASPANPIPTFENEAPLADGTFTDHNSSVPTTSFLQVPSVEKKDTYPHSVKPLRK
ncbi:hypothetical protein N9V90_00610 [Endozoicomonas sp.]|nr:hypothetical protein [Endozoicomonas sp.]